MNEQYLHPALLGHYPPGAEGHLRRGLATMAGGGFRTDPAEARLRRHQLLHPQRRRAQPSYPLDAGMVKQPQATYTETGWEVFAQGLTDLLAWFKRTYGDLPVYITENGAAFFDPPGRRRQRPRPRPAAHRLPAPPPARRARGDPRRRGRARLHGLVAARQHGMVAGLLPALRHRPRGLRHPAAHAQRQRPLLPARGRQPRPRAGGGLAGLITYAATRRGMRGPVR